MDLIYDYKGDSSTDNEQGDHGELGSREIRKVYLVTYFNRQIAQAELNKRKSHLVPHASLV